MATEHQSTIHDYTPSKDDVAAGTKRKADESSPAKDRKAAKKQATLEETIGMEGRKNDEQETDMKETSSGEINNDTQPTKEESDLERSRDESNGNTAEAKDAKINNGDAVQESSERKENLPSSILEKGLIYFFTRNRVGIDDADSVGDLQRTFFVLRPLPIGAKLGDGALPDLENNRLFALPKKVFPKSHNDRFMAFTEKAPASIKDLKDNFMKGSSYETKTSGTRQVDPVTTVAEGVYAITRTENRTTHLAYALTIPSELGELQEDLGLRSQGSFVVSVKNPERSGPSNASLPEKPDFPKEIIDEFRGLAWSEVKPNYLDYANVQILLIGERIESALEPTTKDKKHNKEEPKQELEELEHEDELRVKHLEGDDSIFNDLRISQDEFSKVPTTW